MTAWPHCVIGIAAAAAAAISPLGIAAILALAAGLGILRFHSLRLGASVLGLLTAFIAAIHLARWSPLLLVTRPPQATAAAHPASLTDLATFFLGVGAFTFGGGLTMIAFIQEQVVNQFQWITHQEFLGGLALGQFAPGPIIVVAAYVGYKIAGIPGAATATLAIFLPSFILTLAVLPMFERVRGLVWTKAAMQGLGPAVIGVLAVSLVRLAPHALPDPFAIAILIGTLIALLGRRVGAMKLMLAGAVLGELRSRLMPLPGVRLPL